MVRRDRASGPRSKEAVRAIPLPSNPAPRAQAVRDAPRAQASRDDHSHSESEPSSDSENSQADAEEDPAEDAPRDPAVDAPNAEPDSFGTSFAESVRLLGVYRPSAVEEAPTKESFLTAADEICGTSASKSSSDPTFLLKESRAVGGELLAVQSYVRDTTSAETKVPTNLSQVDFPWALPLGKYTSARRCPVTDASFQNDVIPSQTLNMSSDDDLLKKGSQGGKVSLSDKTLSSWEKTARSGLLSLSALDSFFGGVLSQVWDGNQTQEVNPEHFLQMVQQVSCNLKFAAHAMASLHTNCILARREALLGKSTVIKTPGKKATLRSLPPKETHLFSGIIRQTLSEQAELAASLVPGGKSSHKSYKRSAAASEAAAPPAKAAKPAKPAKTDKAPKFTSKPGGKGGKGKASPYKKNPSSSAKFAKPHPQ